MASSLCRYISFLSDESFILCAIRKIESAEIRIRWRVRVRVAMNQIFNLNENAEHTCLEFPEILRYHWKTNCTTIVHVDVLKPILKCELRRFEWKVSWEGKHAFNCFIVLPNSIGSSRNFNTKRVINDVSILNQWLIVNIRWEFIIFTEAIEFLEFLINARRSRLFWHHQRDSVKQSKRCVRILLKINIFDDWWRR